ncbi:MAG: hypothetical protein ACLPKI_21085 [Streptosporangiaceae bacterium]
MTRSGKPKRWMGIRSCNWQQWTQERQTLPAATPSRGPGGDGEVVAQPRRGAQQPAGQFGAGIQQMLAVIQYQQQFTPADDALV